MISLLKSEGAHVSSVGVCRNRNLNRNLNPIFRFALRRSPYLHEHDQDYD